MKELGYETNNCLLIENYSSIALTDCVRTTILTSRIVEVRTLP